MRFSLTALVIVFFATACRVSGPVPKDAAPRPSPSAGVTVHVAPAGTREDPLSGLPPTQSRARLLVSTSDDEVPLMILDLGLGRTTAIPGIPGGGLQEGVFTSDGGVVFAAGPRTLGFVDPQGVRRSATVLLPADVPGSIVALSTTGDSLVVGTRVTQDGREREARTVLFGLDGSHRCTGPVGSLFAWDRGGQLWSADLRSRLDPSNCETSAGLALEGFEGPLFFLTSGSNGYLSAEGNSLSRFNLETGVLKATSPRQSEPITDVVIRDDIWALAGGELVRLDAETLELKSSSHLLLCAYHPTFIEAQDALYLIDDCYGVLYRISRRSGALVEGWALPLDEGSDIQAYGVPTGEGIWLVDEEQTGEPYFFDPKQERFERLPDEVRDDSIYALVFGVHLPAEAGPESKTQVPKPK